jgi:anhydro-N-acetylmuramic acid kinase
VNEFIEKNNLQHQVQLISSHGHTVFHAPQKGMTAQLGDGAAIAATTGINTVSDLRALDVALGGQGAPIVPMGEKLFWNEMDYFLNLGGIANLSANNKNAFIAYDICPANRVLNMLAQQSNKAFDEDGDMAKTGTINTALLDALNSLEYYSLSSPKSLDNSFGVETVFPLIESFQLSIPDSLRTYTEHIVHQISYSFKDPQLKAQRTKLLVTGGGAFNIFLIERLEEALLPFSIDLVIPEDNIVKYKEALIMALLGVLRWREENTVMSSVTGASRSSIGGAVWIGQEA